jgi:hypothetical protein
VRANSLNGMAISGLMVLLACGFAPKVLAAETASNTQQFGAEQAIATDQLDQSRGGADTTNNNVTTVTNSNDVNGTVDRNSATNVVSGNNTIDGGAFTGANGFPMVIQNSGSNVLIQNSTILTLELK